LAALNIRYDRFIDPLTTPASDVLPRIARSVIDQLSTRTGALRIVKEAVPYSLKYQMPIVGGLIEGSCPHCASSMGGFFCERCGAETSPDKLVEPRSRLPDDRWEWRSYESLFLHVDDVAGLRATASRICQDRKLVDIAFDGLALNNNLIRLTHPGSWGIPLDGHGVSAGSVIFTYPALLALSLLCAGASGDSAVADETAFALGNDSITIASFGIDNSMPYLVSVLGQTLCAGDSKPYDHYLTNYFGTLDGKKFSTSRNHAIWALDAHRLLNASTDTIRAYLTLVNPQHGEADFSVASFAEFKSEWQDRLEKMIEESCDTGLARPGTPDIARLHELLEQRDIALDPGRFSLSDVAQAIHAWIRIGTNEGHSHAWALGLSVLAYPVMPEISERIWRGHGLPGIPSVEQLSPLWPA